MSVTIYSSSISKPPGAWFDGALGLRVVHACVMECELQQRKARGI